MVIAFLEPERRLVSLSGQLRVQIFRAEKVAELILRPSIDQDRQIEGARFDQARRVMRLAGVDAAEIGGELLPSPVRLCGMANRSKGLNRPETSGALGRQSERPVSAH